MQRIHSRWPTQSDVLDVALNDVAGLIERTVSALAARGCWAVPGSAFLSEQRDRYM